MSSLSRWMLTFWSRIERDAGPVSSGVFCPGFSVENGGKGLAGGYGPGGHPCPPGAWMAFGGQVRPEMAAVRPEGTHCPASTAKKLGVSAECSSPSWRKVSPGPVRDAARGAALVTVQHLDRRRAPWIEQPVQPANDLPAVCPVGRRRIRNPRRWSSAGRRRHRGVGCPGCQRHDFQRWRRNWTAAHQSQKAH
jgi:hypothetical protein